MRFLITAGPTREYLDAVRFLGNASSGRMGSAVAAAAAKAGHRVQLVSGPVDLPNLPGVTVTRVTSTQEMYQACAKLFARVDCLVGAAAPADFRPVRRVPGKQKKTRAPLTLQLKPTVDILATLGRRKKRQVVIAFALEVRKPVANAIKKLRAKNADAIVLNSPAAMGAAKSSVVVIRRDSPRIEAWNATKETIARRLVQLAERLHAERR